VGAERSLAAIVWFVCMMVLRFGLIDVEAGQPPMISRFQMSVHWERTVASQSGS